VCAEETPVAEDMIIGKAERARINVSEDYELDCWSRRFAVGKAVLRRAVAKVGPVAADVERELARRADGT